MDKTFWILILSLGIILSGCSRLFKRERKDRVNRCGLESMDG
jgi:hypothetical protein